MDNEKSKMDIKKLERVIIVAEEFARQYLCWQESKKHYSDSWNFVALTISNNFFDIALLNWAHLFGNSTDQLHIEKTLGDHKESFVKGLQAKLGMNDEKWKAYWDSMKRFRDKRIAHIGEEHSIEVPLMSTEPPRVSRRPLGLSHAACEIAP